MPVRVGGQSAITASALESACNQKDVTIISQKGATAASLAAENYMGVVWQGDSGDQVSEYEVAIVGATGTRAVNNQRVIGTRPRVSVTSDVSTLLYGQTATISFELTQTGNLNDLGAIVVSGGRLGAITGSGTTYSATFTPDTNATTSGVITVGNAAFKTLAANLINKDAAEADNRVSIAVNTVLNAVPTARAGVDRTVASAASVTLDGTGSDANDPGQTLSHAWIQTGGVAVVLSDPTAAEPRFTAPTLAIGDADALLSFSLTVNDGFDSSAADTVVITVQAPLDTEAPVVTGPADITAPADAGTATVVVTYTAPTATDNVGLTSGPTLTAGLASGSAFPVGVTTVTYEATDAAGNTGTVSFTVTVTPDVTAPTISIAALTGASNDDLTAEITLSEASTDFEASDLNLTNANAILTGRGTSYTAVLTPVADGEVALSVAANSFTDGVGNVNTASNRVTAIHDATAPTISIADFTGPLNGDLTAVVTLSEASTSFTQADLSLVNATANLSGSGSSYTAVLTPLADGTVSLSVAAGTFTDAAGNGNTASNEVTSTHDATAPTISIADFTGPLNGDLTLSTVR
ncbi:hypothetical protein P775_01635 [Puniceibacterium antarcticum]|uniref:HYR domain-containing protein n=1 Tax=Puniceibacterium antarcticum TaxID=1206336 RepID=A0A2G8RKF6_9RHOB|nr:hypothetical protein P775_01635 [Puniceibacterium antarcticum]